MSTKLDEIDQRIDLAANLTQTALDMNWLIARARRCEKLETAVALSSDPHPNKVYISFDAASDKGDYSSVVIYKRAPDGRIDIVAMATGERAEAFIAEYNAVIEEWRKF